MFILIFILGIIIKKQTIVYGIATFFLIVWYSIDEKTKKEKFKAIIPLLIYLIPLLASGFVLLTSPEPSIKVYITRYDIKHGENFYIYKDLWGMYLLHACINVPAIIQMIPLNNISQKETVFFGGSLSEQFLCEDSCNIYYVIIVNDGEVDVKKITLYTSLYSNEFEIFDGHPKLKFSNNKGSYGDGGFYLETDNMEQGDVRSFSIRLDELYNFTSTCKIEGYNEGCEIKVFNANIYVVSENANGLSLSDHRDGQIKTIALPQYNESVAKIFKLDLNAFVFEERKTLQIAAKKSGGDSENLCFVDQQ